MEDQNDQEKDLAETQSPAPEKPKMFAVHNATRGRDNRTLRALQPVHHRLKQFLDGGKYRCIRGRPIMLPESEFMRLLPEITKKASEGIFVVKSPDGRLVNLETFELGPIPPTPALPNPPLDSIVNDNQNVGENMPKYPGGPAPMVAGEKPDLVAGAPQGEEDRVTDTGEGEQTETSNEIPPPAQPSLVGSAPKETKKRSGKDKDK